MEPFVIVIKWYYKMKSIVELFASTPVPINMGLYYAQDADGDLHRFQSIPSRGGVMPYVQKWNGASKTFVGKYPRVDTWHQSIVKPTANKGFVVIPYMHGGRDVEGEEEVVQTDPSDKRSFTEMPSDVSFANAYTNKASNAKSRNINFGLTFDDFKDVYSNKICAVSGNTLVHDQNADGMNRYSLERVDPSKGYVRGNVIPMAHDLNHAKSHLDRFLMSGISDEHMLRIIYKAEYLLRKRIKEGSSNEKS